MQIFLSYASEDHELADQVHLALAGDGRQVFFDKESLPPAGDYHARIRAAVEQSDIFVFLLSPNSVAPGSYTLTELKYARAKWPHPKGRVLPVRMRDVPWETIPAYLKAVTLLEPEGNLPAEVSVAVSELEREAGEEHSITPELQLKKNKAPSNRLAASDTLPSAILSEIVSDRYIDRVRNRLQYKYKTASEHGERLSLQVVFSELRDMFDRNTFTEPIEECKDKDWGSRFCALCLTLDFLETYWSAVRDQATPADQELMGSYDIVTREVRSYGMTLTVFFHPNLIFTDARDQCRENYKNFKARLRRIALPKKQIDPSDMKRCERHRKRVQKQVRGWLFTAQSISNV
jgi:hypothetical protein